MKKEFELDIYRYASFKEFLTSYYQLRKNDGYGHFNLNSWSDKLGYKSPRIISMVMKGQRAPSAEFQEKLLDYFNLKGNKKKYFEVLSKKAVLEYKGQATLELDQILNSINPLNLELSPVDNKQFSFISEWHHLVIKQMVKLKSFRNDANWISKKLKNKLSTTKVIKSLSLLEELGHIRRINNTYIAGTSIKAGGEIPSIAIKKHHEQMLERAKDSLYEDDVIDRFFYSISMPFEREEMEEAKKMINDFLYEFDARFSSAKNSKTEDIFQIGIQLFPHTKKEKVLH